MLKKSQKRNSESGMAVIEMIPILIIIALLLNFSLGFFGVVHTGILNSIAARNYTFETFRHKADLRYFMREGISSADQVANYMASNPAPYNFRIHAISSDKRTDDRWIATARPIAFIKSFGGQDKDGQDLSEVRTPANTNISLHKDIATTEKIKQNGVALDEKYRVFPVWVRPQYGICLNNACGE
jgi:hypothetical protein